MCDNNRVKKVSLVIPCYNEEAVIPKLISRIEKASKKWKYDWEVICVDDGSKDATLNLLAKQHKKSSKWKVVSFSRNFGHQTAVTCGLHYASGNAVVILDADLQDPPEELEKFFKKWEEGYDVVYAVRKKRKEGIFKKLSYWAFYRILSYLSDYEIPLDSGDFSLMDRKVVDTINKMPERNRFVRGLRAWSGFKQIGVEYDRQARASGEPKYNFKKLLKLASDGLTSFSSKPLVISFYFGTLVSIVSFLGIIFTILQRIFHTFFENIGFGPVPGFATIVISVLFLGGIQLICIGIIGNYLGRIYDEVKQRPLWIAKETLGITKNIRGINARKKS